MPRLILSLMFVLCCFAQSRNDWRLPVQYGTTVPSTCEGGKIFIKTNASAGSNTYACVSGSYVAQGGSSGLTLVETKTASASSALSFTSCFTSTYKNYLVVVEDLLPATNTVNLLLTLSTDGGSTYLSSGYLGGYWVWSAGGGAAGSVGTTSATLAINQSNNSTNRRVSGTIEFKNPLQTTNYKAIDARISGYDGGSHYTYLSTATNSTTSAVNAFRLQFSSGNIASGVAYCFGLAK